MIRAYFCPRPQAHGCGRASQEDTACMTASSTRRRSGSRRGGSTNRARWCMQTWSDLRRSWRLLCAGAGKEETQRGCSIVQAGTPFRSQGSAHNILPRGRVSLCIVRVQWLTVPSHVQGIRLAAQFIGCWCTSTLCMLTLWLHCHTVLYKMYRIDKPCLLGGYLTTDLAASRPK